VVPATARTWTMAAGESGDTAAADAAVVPPSLPIPVADVAVEPGTAAAAAAAADEVATAPSAAAAAAAEPVSAAAAAAAPRTMRHPPTVLANGMEVSVHSVPRLLRYDLGQVLPGVRHDGLLIVTVCQRAAMDLVATGADVAAEKDALLEKVRAYRCCWCDCGLGGCQACHTVPPSLTWLQFVAWARRVQTLLQDRAGAGGGGRSDDAWATWVDPCSGLPVRPSAPHQRCTALPPHAA